MDKPKSNLDFKLMALTYKFRDLRLPRMNILKEAGIKAGFSVLDYGCGPGSCINPLADLVGKSGKIYALDIHPMAIKKIRTMTVKKGLANVDTIYSGCETGLQDNSIDVVLLYDVFHDLSNRKEVLDEIHRILKPGGILSFSDHHMKEGEIVTGITDTGLFGLKGKGERTYSFFPQELNAC